MQIRLQIITFIYFTKIITQAAQILVGLVHKASLFVCFLYIIGLFDKTNGALFLLVTFLCRNIKGTTNFNFNFQTVMSDAVFA